MNIKKEIIILDDIYDEPDSEENEILRKKLWDHVNEFSKTGRMSNQEPEIQDLNYGLSNMERQFNNEFVNSDYTIIEERLVANHPDYVLIDNHIPFFDPPIDIEITNRMRENSKSGLMIGMAAAALLGSATNHGGYTRDGYKRHPVYLKLNAGTAIGKKREKTLNKRAINKANRKKGRHK